MSQAQVAALPTPSRLRNYESARSDESQPKGFRIDEETFQCEAECPAGIYLDVADRLESAGADENRQGLAGLGLIKDFYDAILLKDDAGEEGDESSHARFFALLRAPKRERVVSLNLLGTIMKDLMEDYGGRPMAPGSPSPG